ncbi:hypothetical protein N656DRAFT_682221, partial [Canariomyces notabilis]
TPYLGYGSNMWKEQMALRCPASPFMGVGRFRGYKWFINARGYANIVPVTVTPDPKPGTRTSNDDYANQVWGLVYNLSPEDEAQLDINEGVPYAYEKRMLEAEFWPAVGHKSSTRLWARRTRSKCQKKTLLPVLVYIDFQRADDHNHDHEGQQHLPGDEYVYRMNRGIKDALREGVPGGYVEKVLRRDIPPRENEEEDE